MTHPHEAPAATPADRGFLRVFFAVLLALLTAATALTVLVDPLGVFGTGLVPPMLTRDRDEKAARFRAIRPPPAVVILGSSRSKSLPPSCVTAGTELPAFNFAVNGAGTEDLVAVLGFVLEEGRPQRVIVGVDPEMFQGGEAIRPALASSRALARFAPGEERSVLSGPLGADLFGWQAVSAALRSLAGAGRESTDADSTTLDPDGRTRLVVAEARWRRDPAAGAERIAGSLPGVIARYGAFPRLDSLRIAYFLSFLGEARAAGIEVTAFIPPVHPALERAAAGTNWRPRTGETVALLQDLERRDLLRYVETRDLARGADSTAFVDVLHFLSPVANRVVETVAGRPGACALQ